MKVRLNYTIQTHIHPEKRPRTLSPGGIFVYQRDPIANTTTNTKPTC